jgi:hypothetical protein
MGNLTQKLAETEVENGVRMSEVRRIYNDLDATQIRRVVGEDGGYKVVLERSQGYCLFCSPTSKFRIKSVIGRGDEETVTVRLVEKV